MTSKGILQTLSILYKEYSWAKCDLIYHTPWQLLLATILSSRTKDETVNRVTTKLFNIYPDIKDIANIDLRELEKLIYSSGFYKNKSIRIKNAAKIILKKHSGVIPNDMANLIKIPGIGRKTANVVLSEYFKKGYGIVVDTHVARISFRLGWTESINPLIIERDLLKTIPKTYWIDLSHKLIQHGRIVCTSQKPNCEKCVIKALCVYYKIIRKAKSLKANRQKIQKS